MNQSNETIYWSHEQMGLSMSFTRLLLLIIISSMGFACTHKPETEAEKISYAYGVQIANSLKKQTVELDPKMVAEGVQDVLKNQKLHLSDEEIQTALLSLSKSNEQKQHEITQDQLEQGRKFIEEFIKKHSALVSPKGIAYRVIKQGNGTKASVNQKVKIHYEGRLTDGKVFDSTRLRGAVAEFPLNNVIPGWKEVLTMMPAGSRWEVVIPPQLAYGDTGNQLIPGNSTVVFDIELIEVR